HDVIDALGHFHDVDRKLDIHIAFDPAPALRVGIFFQRLSDDREPVVVEPVDQRTKWREFLLLGEGGVIESADEQAFAREQFQQALIIDIELQAFGSPIKVGSVDKKRNLLLRIKKHLWPPFKSPNTTTRPKLAGRPQLPQGRRRDTDRAWSQSPFPGGRASRNAKPGRSPDGATDP